MFYKIRDNDWSIEAAESFMRFKGIADNLVKSYIKNGQCTYAFNK